MTNRNYLATIVVDPRGAEGTNNEMIPKLSEAILQSEGEVLKVEEQGSIDFAYPQQKELVSGNFIQFEFKGSTNSPSLLREKLKLEKKVDRLIVERT